MATYGEFNFNNEFEWQNECYEPRVFNFQLLRRRGEGGKKLEIYEFTNLLIMNKFAVLMRDLDNFDVYLDCF